MRIIHLRYIRIHGGEISALPNEVYMGDGFIYCNYYFDKG